MSLDTHEIGQFLEGYFAAQHGKDFDPNEPFPWRDGFGFFHVHMAELQECPQ